jgi:signal transduction histidine kinase
VEEETQKRLYHEHILIQQSKMAAMGEMIAAIAHQWRQPINAIGLIVQDMDDAYDFGEVDKPYLTTVISGVMEQILFMSNTIDDFRNFFAADKDRTIFDAKKAVESVLSILAEQFRNKSIRVLHDCSCQQHSMKLCDNLSIGICSNGYMNISGYRNEFKQVVLNILNNAREAIEDAKERREAADRRSAGTRDSSHGASSHALSSGGEISVAMSFHPQDSIVEIRISDTGGGIPDDVMPNIFKPYYTTKGDLKGTGIGLYLAKTIVENNMGGTIDAANSEKGAVFTIRLKHAP